MKNALTVSVCLALSLLAGSLGAQTTAPASAGGAMGHESKQMHEQMMSGMQKMQGMQLTGVIDKDFAMMMRMHHQQAIDMAQAEIEHGKSPEMKALAKKIVDDQKKEIAEFDKYLAKRK